jgi:hypothetical protein
VKCNRAVIVAAEGGSSAPRSMLKINAPSAPNWHRPTERPIHLFSVQKFSKKVKKKLASFREVQ